MRIQNGRLVTIENGTFACGYVDFEKGKITGFGDLADAPASLVEFIGEVSQVCDVYSFTGINELTKDTYTYEEFIAMVEQNPNLAAVRVHKQRFGYMVNGTICEVGNVLINGAKVVTINSESTEIEDIKKTIADVGLEGVENINYLQAIKRVIGMSNKPLANE